MQVGDTFDAYFGSNLRITQIIPGVQILGLYKQHQRPFARDLVEYETSSGYRGKILASLVKVPSVNGKPIPS